MEKLEGANTQKIKNEVSKEIASSAVLEDTGGEITFSLPLKDLESYVSLFKRLERKSNKLKIGSYGVTLTTLEQVFLKLGEEAKQKEVKEQSGADEGVVIEVITEVMMIE